MLVGVVLGIIITLLVLCCIYLAGQNRAYAGQVNELAKQQAAAEIAIGRFAAQAQADANKQIVFNLTEQQVTELAHKISSRVQTMLDAQNEAALNKLN
jgi:hypothetical protein